MTDAPTTYGPPRICANALREKAASVVNAVARRRCMAISLPSPPLRAIRAMDPESAERAVHDRSLSRVTEESRSADPGETIAPRPSAVVAVALVFFWQNSCRLSSAVLPMSALQKPIYRFGEFELDPDERRLLAHGVPVTLTPKVFDTLVLLVERAGHAISKDELMHALWPRGFVDESNLTKHIWLIRKALGEGENDARWIETVPKLGYRFAAAVQRVARSEASLITDVHDSAFSEPDAAARAATLVAPDASGAPRAQFAEDASSIARDARPTSVSAASRGPSASRFRTWSLVAAALIVAFAVIMFLTRERPGDVSAAADARAKAVA